MMKHKAILAEEESKVLLEMVLIGGALPRRSSIRTYCLLLTEEISLGIR